MAKKKKSAFDKVLTKAPKKSQAASQNPKQLVPSDFEYLKVLMEVELTATPSKSQIARWLNCPSYDVRVHTVRREDIKFSPEQTEMLLKDVGDIKGDFIRFHAHKFSSGLIDSLLQDMDPNARLTLLLNENLKVSKPQFDALFDDERSYVRSMTIIKFPELLSSEQVDVVLRGSSLNVKCALVWDSNFAPSLEQCRVALHEIDTNKPHPPEEGISEQQADSLLKTVREFWETKRPVLESADLKESVKHKVGNLSDPRLDSAL